MCLFYFYINKARARFLNPKLSIRSVTSYCSSFNIMVSTSCDSSIWKISILPCSSACSKTPSSMTKCIRCCTILVMHDLPHIFDKDICMPSVLLTQGHTYIYVHPLARACQMKLQHKQTNVNYYTWSI